jgi:uncharacterized protein (TIGR03083 family)
MTTDATTPTTTPRELGYEAWMSAAEEEYARLLEQVATLNAAQWAAPTDCEGWAVRDVVAHLVGAAAGNASVREMARQAWASRASSVRGDLIDRINDIQVSERRDHPVERLRADLRDVAVRGVAGRRRLPAALRALPVPFGPPLGTRTIGYLMGRIYTRDAWMHRVDIARAAGLPLRLTPEHDGRIVEDVVGEWAVAHGRPFALHLEGPAGGHWQRPADSGGSPPEIRLDAVDFARMLSGRATGTGLLAQTVPF